MSRVASLRRPAGAEPLSEPCEGPERVLKERGHGKPGDRPGAPTLDRAGNALPFSPRPVAARPRVYTVFLGPYKGRDRTASPLPTSHLDSDKCSWFVPDITEWDLSKPRCRSRSPSRARAASRSAWAMASPSSSPLPATVFDEIDEALGLKLSSIMWEGPEDRLVLTENAQPALMAVSLAALAVLGAEFGIGVCPHRPLRRRPFAGRIFRSGGGRQLHPVRCRPAAEDPRPGHAAGDPGRHRAPWRRCSASICRGGGRHCRGSRRRPGVPGGQ